jgi:hypothetical protein
MRTVAVPEWWADEAGPTPFLIELTAKRWKALILISAGLMALGFFALGWALWVEVYRPIFDLDQPRRVVEPLARFKEAMTGVEAWVGWLLLIAATALGIYARFMAWWRHG